MSKETFAGLMRLAADRIDDQLFGLAAVMWHQTSQMGSDEFAYRFEESAIISIQQRNETSAFLLNRILEVFGHTLPPDPRIRVHSQMVTLASIFGWPQFESLLTELNSIAFEYRTDPRIWPSVCYRMGDWELRGSSYAKAIKWFEETLNCDPSHLQALIMLAMAFNKVGESEKALNLLEKALLQAKAKESVESQAEVTRHLADTYFNLDRYDEAARHYLYSIRVMRRHETGSSDLAYAMEGLGATYKVLKPRKSKLWLDRSLRISGLGQVQISRSYFALAQAALDADDLLEAERYLNLTLEIRKLEPESAHYLSALEVQFHLERMKAHSLGLTLNESAVSCLPKGRQFWNLLVKLAVGMEPRHLAGFLSLYTRGIQGYLLLMFADGDVFELVQCVEQYKSLLQMSEIMTQRSGSSSAASKRRELARLSVEIEGCYRNTHSDQSAVEELRTLELRRELLIGELRKEAFEIEGFDVSKVGDVIGEGTVLLHWLHLSHRGFWDQMLCLSWSDLGLGAHFPATESAMQLQIGERLRDLRQVPNRIAQVAAEGGNLLSELGEELPLLLPPELRKAIAGAKRLIVCPHADLWNYPFGSMRLEPDGPPIQEFMDVSVCESISTLIRAKRNSSRKNGDGIFFGGVAEFGQGHSLPSAESLMRGGDGHPNLDAIPGEIGLSSACYEASASRSLPMTRVDFWRAAERSDAMVIASHGVEGSDGESMGFLVHRENGQGFEPIQAGEFLTKTLPPRLFILSTCVSARGEALPGVGLLGLVHSLHRAGASTVIGSLWPVNDQETAALMVKFHEIWSRRYIGVASAFRKAIRESKVSEATWAAFVVSGDPDLTWKDPGHDRFKHPMSAVKGTSDFTLSEAAKVWMRLNMSQGGLTQKLARIVKKW